MYVCKNQQMARVVPNKVFRLTWSKSRPKPLDGRPNAYQSWQDSKYEIRLNCVQCSCYNTNTVTHQLWESDITGQLAKYTNWSKCVCLRF